MKLVVPFILRESPLSLYMYHVLGFANLTHQRIETPKELLYDFSLVAFIRYPLKFKMGLHPWTCLDTK